MNPIIIAQRYELKELINTGGKGAIFKALDKVTQNTVALKLLLNDDIEQISIEIKNHFLKGAKICTEIEHKNLVKTIDFGEDFNKGPFLVMEYLHGTPLSEMIYNDFTEKQILHIGYQILLLLDFLHKKNILHGDIKPENIFVLKGKNKYPDLKVLDFIPMRRLSDWQTLGLTPEYTPPEIFSGSPPSPAFDLFSLGVLLYELTFKKLPEFSNYGLKKSEKLKEFKYLANLLLQFLSFNPKIRFLAQNQLIALQEKKIKTIKVPQITQNRTFKDESFSFDIKALKTVLRISAEQSPISIIILNHKLKTIYMNKTAISLLGNIENFGESIIAFEKPILMNYLQNALETGKVSFYSMNIDGITSGIWISPLIDDSKIIAVQIIITPEHNL